jgi:hypothetical protein
LQYALTALAGLVPAFAVLFWNEHERRHHDEELARLRSDVGAIQAVQASSVPPEIPAATFRALPVAPAPPPVVAPAIPPVATAVAAKSARPGANLADAESGVEKQPALGVQEMRDNLESAFVADHGSTRLDGRSKDEAMQKLRANLPSGSSLRSFECHETLCRIETRHLDRESHVEFVRAAFMNPDTYLWNGGFYSFREDDNATGDGPMEFVTYLAQPNQSLPLQ